MNAPNARGGIGATAWRKCHEKVRWPKRIPLGAAGLACTGADGNEREGHDDVG
jgi:hypothetical protein